MPTNLPISFEGSAGERRETEGSKYRTLTYFVYWIAFRILRSIAITPGATRHV